jgi:hypothetical protein
MDKLQSEEIFLLGCALGEKYATNGSISETCENNYWPMLRCHTNLVTDIYKIKFVQMKQFHSSYSTLTVRTRRSKEQEAIWNEATAEIRGSQNKTILSHNLELQYKLRPIQESRAPRVKLLVQWHKYTDGRDSEQLFRINHLKVQSAGVRGTPASQRAAMGHEAGGTIISVRQPFRRSFGNIRFAYLSSGSLCLKTRQRLGKNPLIDARQRLGRNVNAVMNTHATTDELLDASFSMWPVSYQGKYEISSSQNFLLYTACALISNSFTWPA